MKEQDIYKNILLKIIDQTEKFQIESSQELIQRLIVELDYYELPKVKGNQFG